MKTLSKTGEQILEFLKKKTYRLEHSTYVDDKIGHDTFLDVNLGEFDDFCFDVNVHYSYKAYRDVLGDGSKDISFDVYDIDVVLNFVADAEGDELELTTFDISEIEKELSNSIDLLITEK